VTARSEEETRRYRETRDIHVTGEGVPKPVQTFDEASFPGGCWRWMADVGGGCVLAVWVQEGCAEVMEVRLGSV
jgi:hypothetical protein